MEENLPKFENREELVVNSDMAIDLRKAMSWAKFLSIMMFIGTGMMFLLSIVCFAVDPSTWFDNDMEPGAGGMLVPIFNYLLFHRIIGVSLLALHKGIQSPQFQGLIGIIAPHGSQSTAALQQHPIVCRKFPASADLALILLGHGLLHRRYINLS